MKMQVRVSNQTYEVEVGDVKARPILVQVDGETFEVWPSETGGQPAVVQPVVSAPAPAPVVEKPAAAPCEPAPQRAAPVAGNKANCVTAPIPGVIESIRVKAGDPVEFGQELFVLEAMKMKNSIKATKAGKVASIHVSAGETVTHGQVLLQFSD